MRERQAWIDAARGFALALVVLLHTVAWLRSFGFTVSPWLMRADAILDGFRMPTLVLISGMLAASVTSWSWREVLRRRVGPLMLLYVVWVPIAVLGIAWFRDGVASLQGSDVAYLLIRPDQRMWYFYALALYIAAARLLRAVPAAPLLTAAIIANLVAVGWLHGLELPHDFQSWAYVLQHWVFFVAAERLVAAYSRVAGRRSALRGLAALVAFWVFGALAIAIDLIDNAIAILILGVLGTAVTLTLFPVIGGHWALGWARAVGRRSLGVYALHAVTAAGVAAALADRLPRFAGAGVLLPVAVTALVVLVAYGITVALGRWAPVPFLRPWWSTAAREPKTVHAPAQ